MSNKIMIQPRILQVAVVALATICCFALTDAQHQSGLVECTGSQLDDVVRTISKTRVETRNIKPKLARCESFVKVIGEQRELDSLEILSGGQNEPSVVFGYLGEILNKRASCPGQPMGGLSLLQELVEDCRELIELANRKPQAVPQERTKTTPTTTTTTTTERPRAPAVESSEFQKPPGIQKLRELFAEQAQTIGQLKGTNAKLEGANSQLESDLSGLRDQLEQVEDNAKKATSDIATKGTCGATEYEVEVRRGKDGRFGFGLKPILGGAFVKIVFAGSPAAEAGLRFGDQVLLIDGRPAADREVRESSSKSQEPLKFLVRKSPFEQIVVVKKTSEEESWGVTIVAGEVKDVRQDSPASRAGLLTGMQLISINGANVLGLSESLFNKIVSDSGLQMSLTLLPTSVYKLMAEGVDLAEVRLEANKQLF